MIDHRHVAVPVHAMRDLIARGWSPTDIAQAGGLRVRSVGMLIHNLDTVSHVTAHTAEGIRLANQILYYRKISPAERAENVLEIIIDLHEKRHMTLRQISIRSRISLNTIICWYHLERVPDYETYLRLVRWYVPWVSRPRRGRSIRR